MGFFRAAHYHHRGTPPDAIGVSIPQAASKGTAYLKVTMGLAAAERLCVAAGDRLDLLWGDGEDVGSILVFKGTDGAGIKIRPLVHSGTSAGRGFYANFGHLPTEPIADAQGKRRRLILLARGLVRLQPIWRDDGAAVRSPDDWWAHVPEQRGVDPELRQQLVKLTAVPMPRRA